MLQKSVEVVNRSATGAGTMTSVRLHNAAGSTATPSSAALFLLLVVWTREQDIITIPREGK